MFTQRIFLSALVVVVLSFAPNALFAQPAGAQGEDFLYRVMKGDTLGQLAERFTSGTFNWTTLQSHNRVQDPTRLPIGQLLKIPFALIPELPSSAVVRHIVGQASMDGRQLQMSSRVAEGQTVKTASSGFVALQLDDGSQLAITPSSSLTMLRLRVFKGTGLTDSIINVDKGSIESEVAPQETGVGRFEIRTPVSVTGVRGTSLRVHMSEQGARSEVLKGYAGVGAEHSPEVVLREKQGVAVNKAGKSLGVRDLLPAPVLPAPTRRGGDWSMTFPPVSGASSYLVRVASDPSGIDLVSSRLFTSTQVQFGAPGPGTYYVFVRAIDDVGIGGVDAQQPFEGKLVLLASDGAPILSGYGLPIAVSNY